MRTGNGFIKDQKRHFSLFHKFLKNILSPIEYSSSSIIRSSSLMHDLTHISRDDNF